MFKHSCYIENSQEAREWLTLIGIRLNTYLYFELAKYIYFYNDTGIACFINARDLSMMNTETTDCTSDTKSPFGKWKNKLFMTAESARYSIKITEVRAERLQDISSEDCVKEGIFKHISNDKTYWENGFDGLIYGEPRQAYEALINLINGKDTWKNNPFVWVYDYKLTTKLINHE